MKPSIGDLQVISLLCVHDLHLFYIFDSPLDCGIMRALFRM